MGKRGPDCPRLRKHALFIDGPWARRETILARLDQVRGQVNRTAGLIVPKHVDVELAQKLQVTKERPPADSQVIGQVLGGQVMVRTYLSHDAENPGQSCSGLVVRHW